MGIYSFESHFPRKKNFVERELENADYWLLLTIYLLSINYIYGVRYGDKLRKQIGNFHPQSGRLFSLGLDCQRWLWDSIMCCCINVLHLRNIGKTKLLIKRNLSQLVPKSLAWNQNSKCQLLFFESDQVYDKHMNCHW